MGKVTPISQRSTHGPSFATTLLAALVVSGCGAGTAATTSTSPPPAASHPATTPTPNARGLRQRSGRFLGHARATQLVALDGA